MVHCSIYCKKMIFCIKKIIPVLRGKNSWYNQDMRNTLKKIIIILFALILFIPQIFSGRTEEFKYMADEIGKNHKNFYNSVSKEECKNEFERLSETIEDISYADYYFSLTSYLALSHDSHTFIKADDIFSHFLYFPLQLNYIGNSVYVVSGVKEYRDTMGKEVLSINGVSIKDIEEKASPIIPHDNQVYLRQNLNNLLNNTSFLSFIHISDTPQSTVELAFSDGTKTTVTPSLSTEIKKENLVSALTSYSPYIYQGYYRAIIINRDTLLISYNVCAENPDYPIKTFTNDIKSILASNKVSRIIVDLRYNGGGDSSVINPVIKLLKKEKCKKYALIGENTFSSAILNAVSLKEDAGFVLVGSPTGGSINHYGDLKSFTLPETGWNVYYSSKYFKLSKKYEGSLIPDIFIKIDALDYFSGKDNAVEYCLKTEL